MSSDRRSEGGGLSITTLLIAGASSAVAAFVVPRIWQQGTVFAAAMTPIIVALVCWAARSQSSPNRSVSCESSHSEPARLPAFR